MKKTLKTFINTGILMLFVSHSYGLVFNLPNLINQESTPSSNTLLGSNTHPEFNGVDNTFDGSVIFNFTMNFDQFTGPRPSDARIYFVSDSSILFEIGSSRYHDNWIGVRAGIGVIDLGTNPVVKGQSQAFTLTIDYNAGALDTGTILLDGDSTVYDLGEFDYSFRRIGFGNTPPPASFTNMSVEIVPEPATYAFLSGALAFVFVAIRRRFKD